ncbi:hypothetical protein IVA88_24920 [Bradyrhizobium sp. 149]|uniref:hypothetical protein n=1 Tax=Bradyrhizobium sp. 149 TaxID=2782624 RepID=UPI001FF75B9F|nr:hypothetical protein [Bradyrhizobium sp. 149]MCK1654663.1 hypothetical protein [Bradyrhizobium sp. 149]
MTERVWCGPTLSSTDDDAAEHMADALTYLSRAAADAGYDAVAADLIIVRDKLNLLAVAGKADRKRANA